MVIFAVCVVVLGGIVSFVVANTKICGAAYASIGSPMGSDVGLTQAHITLTGKGLFRQQHYSTNTGSDSSYSLRVLPGVYTINASVISSTSNLCIDPEVIVILPGVTTHFDIKFMAP